MIKFSFAYMAATFYSNAGDESAISLEYAFYAFTMGNFTDSKSRVESTVADSDNNPFKRLKTFTVTFYYARLHDYGITCFEIWNSSLHLFSVDLFDNFIHINPLNSPVVAMHWQIRG